MCIYCHDYENHIDPHNLMLCISNLKSVFLQFVSKGNKYWFKKTNNIEVTNLKTDPGVLMLCLLPVSKCHICRGMGVVFDSHLLFWIFYKSFSIMFLLNIYVLQNIWLKENQFKLWLMEPRTLQIVLSGFLGSVTLYLQIWGCRITNIFR